MVVSVAVALDYLDLNVIFFNSLAGWQWVSSIISLSVSLGGLKSKEAISQV